MFVEVSFHGQSPAAPKLAMQQHPMSVQVEVDYQGGGSYKRKYRVREIIPRGPFDITFKNEQVSIASKGFLTGEVRGDCFSWFCYNGRWKTMQGAPGSMQCLNLLPGSSPLLTPRFVVR